MSTTYQFDRFEIRRDTVLWAALIVNTHLLMIFAYYAISPNRYSGPTVVIPPVVWTAVSIWVFARTDLPAASQRQRTIALAVATGYLGLLAYFGGLWGLGTPGPVQSQLTVFSLPPGWNPLLKVQTPVVDVTLIPYMFLGYLALALLVYRAVLDAAGSAISGVLGLLSCVSCTWPVIASIVASVLGGSTAIADAALDQSFVPSIIASLLGENTDIAGAALNQSYLLSTVVFVATVALLYWRPGWR